MDGARFPNRILWIALFLGVASGLLWLSGEVAERNAIARLSAETRGAAILRQAYLKSEIERFRLRKLALGEPLQPTNRRRLGYAAKPETP